MSQGLAAGLADPVHDSQRQFRDLLDAMSRPGRAVRLSGALPVPPPPLMPAAYALLLGLLDHDTSLWLDEACGPAAASLRFHTGVALAGEQSAAQFALVADGMSLTSLDRFAQGELDYPDRSTTVLVQVQSLSRGDRLRLKGPGIDGSAELCVDGLPGGFRSMLARRRSRFPMGVDLVLVAGREIACLPRTAVVTET